MAAPVKNLVVGDVHATPDELEDCEALLQFVVKVAKEHDVNTVTFLGDQYDTWDVVNTKCIDFWQRWLCKLATVVDANVCLVGNHDQVSPTHQYPHAMLAHQVESYVISKPGTPPLPNCIAMPYFHDPVAFVSAVKELVAQNPQAHTLFCHQTFQGAKYDNGFFAKDAIQLDDVPESIRYVISGHIHTPQVIGKRCLYPGSPRWRTLSDANIDRSILLFEHTESSTRLVSRVPTGDVCRRIWYFQDYPDQPYDGLGAIAKDQIRIDVYGPNDKYVRERETELKAKYGARTRGFPDRQRRTEVSEAEGIETSFARFSDLFEPPRGTPRAILKTMIGERLGT